MEENNIVDIFDKNTLEEVRTQFTTFKGYRLLDIRIWRKGATDREAVPTKKGLTISLELIPRLKEAIIKAEKALSSLQKEG